MSRQLPRSIPEPPSEKTVNYWFSRCADEAYASEGSESFISNDDRLVRYAKLFGGDPIPQPSEFASALLSGYEVDRDLHLVHVYDQGTVEATIVMLVRLLDLSKKCGYQAYTFWLRDHGVYVDPILPFPHELQEGRQEGSEFLRFLNARSFYFGNMLPRGIDDYYTPSFQWVNPTHPNPLCRYYITPEIVHLMYTKHLISDAVRNSYLLHLYLDVVPDGMWNVGPPSVANQLRLFAIFRRTCYRHIVNKDWIVDGTFFRLIRTGYIISDVPLICEDFNFPLERVKRAMRAIVANEEFPTLYPRYLSQQCIEGIEKIARIELNMELSPAKSWA